ncbi:MAG: hypothetical protein DWI57_08715 [Chloroflexi bacterium]|nr:MAG: hypothetical protein DWI57_08715 [Chloroflexota bacterium]
MSVQAPSSRFQEAIETVEELQLDDQLLLVEIIRQRLIQYRRSELVSEVAAARDAYQQNDVRRGSVEDLLISHYPIAPID